MLWLYICIFKSFDLVVEEIFFNFCVDFSVMDFYSGVKFSIEVFNAGELFSIEVFGA